LHQPVGLPGDLERRIANAYFDLPASEAGARLLDAHTTWLREMQQWQAAAWHHAALVYIGMLSLSWVLPAPPQPQTVSERIAALSMTVVAGGRD
jgi:hypothetical protein